MALTTGGPKAQLPENWKAPHGFTGKNKVNAMWVGEKAATKEDEKAVEMLGWSVDELTLVGTLDRSWTAKQYLDEEDDLQGPWDFHPREGGEGSLTYQLQHVPEGVDRFAEPRWWIHADGKAVRAKGGEPVHKVVVGKGHWEWHAGARPGSEAEDKQFVWDDDNQFWVVK
jgi:hypothetical protein